MFVSRNCYSDKSVILSHGDSIFVYATDLDWGLLCGSRITKIKKLYAIS